MNDPCSIQVRETGLTCPPISQLKDYLQKIPADSSTCKTFQTFNSIIGISCENNLPTVCSQTPSKPAMWGYRFGTYGRPFLTHQFEYNDVFGHKEVDTFYFQPGNDVKKVFAGKYWNRFSGPLDDTYDKSYESIYRSFLEGDKILDKDSNTYQLKV